MSTENVAKSIESVVARVKFERYETTGYRSKIDPKGPWVPENLQVKEQRTVVFRPVYADTPENKKFFEATPNGEIKLGIVNQEVWPFFRLDTEYDVTFTPVADK